MKKSIYYVLFLTILLTNITLLSNTAVLDKPNPICEFLPIKK